MEAFCNGQAASICASAGRFAGLLLVASWLGCAWWRGDKRMYAPGAGSPAHAIFGNECSECHTQAFRPARQLGIATGHETAVPDAACNRCHAAGTHSGQQIPDAVPACAACHREHGREPPLAEVADRYCIGCHAAPQRRDGQPSTLDIVSDFASVHPEFAAVAHPDADPAAIAFNHQKHLQPGGIPGIDVGRVHLQCGNCQEPDSERRHMSPIRYERHCAECHSNALSVRPIGSWQSAAVDEAAKEFGSRPVPHQTPEMVRGVLRERLTEIAQHYLEDLESKTGATTERPLPGRPRAKPVSETEWSWVNRQLAHAERVLFDAAGGCRYCHRVSEDWQANGLPKLAPTQIRDRWMPRGQFSHGAHGTFTCTECHAAPASSLTSDVLMPSIHSCRQCHTGTRGLNGTASTRCVECHVYHREHDNSSGGSLSLNLKPLDAPSPK